MTFSELAEEILKDAECPLSYKEIWGLAEERGLAKKLAGSGKTPIRSLAAFLYVNIRDKADSIFMFASKKPTTFWLKARERELANLDEMFFLPLITSLTCLGEYPHLIANSS